MEKIKNYLILGLAIALGVLSYIHFQPIDDVVIITDEKTGEVEKDLAEVIRDTIIIEKIIPARRPPQMAP